MDNIKVLVAVLVSSDLPRAIRCIKSCQSQIDYNLDYEVCVVINTLNEEFKREMLDYCNWEGINIKLTKSDGTPSTGKNSVFEVFDDRKEFTHLVQIDGDDFLYPTFLRHIERHLKKYPLTDVLGILPCDSIYVNYEPGFHKLENGLYAGLWGTNYSSWAWWIPFDTDTIFTDDTKGNLSRLMLYSRKITNKFFYDPEQLIGEDYKIHFDLLFAHQKDEISFWFTSASDTWVRDTTSVGIQKQESKLTIDGEHFIKKNEHYQEMLKKYILEKNGEFRSGSGEIPIDFAPMYMNIEDKLKYLNEIL
jgi:hypothetical protein